MSWNPVSSWLLGSGCVLAAIAGCGSSNIELAPVSGTVRLNGQPLAAAVVEFQPVGKPPSVGVTDEAGRFQLQYSKSRWGASIGEHLVKIDHDVDGREGRSKLVPVPPQYNLRSELKREVVVGTNVFEFDLKSPVQRLGFRK